MLSFCYFTKVNICKLRATISLPKPIRELRKSVSKLYLGNFLQTVSVRILESITWPQLLLMSMQKQVLSRQSLNPPASDGVTITLTCCFFIPTAEKRSYSAGAESCGKCSNLRFSNFAAALYHSLLHSGSVKLQKQNPPAMDSV